MSRISFENVTRRFKRGGETFVALENVSFDVREKEFVAIVGPSGCGKTTLLRMAAGLEHPTSGRVCVGDRAVERPGPDRAVVFQQFALFPWKTVAANIGFGLKCKGATSSSWDCRATRRPIRTSSPAACSSAWRSPAAMRSIPACC
jgi:NitT/TauT family transport system ATP-binding protein